MCVECGVLILLPHRKSFDRMQILCGETLSNARVWVFLVLCHRFISVISAFLRWKSRDTECQNCHCCEQEHMYYADRGKGMRVFVWIRIHMGIGMLWRRNTTTATATEKIQPPQALGKTNPPHYSPMVSFKYLISSSNTLYSYIYIYAGMYCGAAYRLIFERQAILLLSHSHSFFVQATTKS